MKLLTALRHFNQLLRSKHAIILTETGDKPSDNFTKLYKLVSDHLVDEYCAYNGLVELEDVVNDNFFNKLVLIDGVYRYCVCSYDIAIGDMCKVDVLGNGTYNDFRFESIHPETEHDPATWLFVGEGIACYYPGIEEPKPFKVLGYPASE